MKIKKNDNVKILAGKDKGKKGKVLKILPKEHKVVIEGINLLTKHVRARREGEKGQRVQFPAPLDVSKVILICSHCNKSVRVGYKVLDNKKKIRYCRQCHQVIDQ
ncbi:MAG: 50S ribosomal protein L24 [Patescibacteria group bacterium]|nr:50S ribosomal protein L24 [Patescibacteria group bacterium]